MKSEEIIISKVVERVKKNLPSTCNIDLNPGSTTYDLVVAIILALLQEDAFADDIVSRQFKKITENIHRIEIGG